MKFVQTGCHKEEKLYENEIECPKCHKLMQKFPYAGSSDIIIDSCRNNCSIWLDKGKIVKIADYLTQVNKPLTQEQKAQVKKQLALLSAKTENKQNLLGILNKRYYNQQEMMSDLDSNPDGNYLGIVYTMLQVSVQKIQVKRLPRKHEKRITTEALRYREHRDELTTENTELTELSLRDLIFSGRSNLGL